MNTDNNIFGQDINALMEVNHYWKERFPEAEGDVSPNYNLSNDELFKKFPFISTILRDGIFWDKTSGIRDYVLFYDDMFFSNVEILMPKGVKNFIRLVVKGENFEATRSFKFPDDIIITELNVAEDFSYSTSYYQCDKHMELFIFEKERNSRTKQNTIILLDKEGSCVDVTMAIKTQEGQKRDDYIEFQHYASDTASDVQYLSLNNGHVTSQANSLLSKVAKQSQSFQNLKHVLLSEKARSFSKPNLMIKNPDVMAKHGNNIGSLEDASLEYLQMRGIEKQQGQKIIQKSMMDNFIDKHPNHQNIKEIFYDL